MHRMKLYIRDYKFIEHDESYNSRMLGEKHPLKFAFWGGQVLTEQQIRYAIGLLNGRVALMSSK